MEDRYYSTWKEFTQEQLRRVGTVQLSIDELEHDMYCDDSAKKNEEETSELNFDY